MLVPPEDSISRAQLVRFRERLARVWVSPIFQFAVTMEHMITAPLELFGHAGLAGPGHSLDQVVFNAQISYLLARAARHSLICQVYSDFAGTALATQTLFVRSEQDRGGGSQQTRQSFNLLRFVSNNKHDGAFCT